VEDDIEVVTDYFRPKVALSNPGNAVIGTGSGACANIVTDLARLDALRQTGALSDSQYQIAVNAVLNACK
jgi:hypothetical protein